MLDDTVRDYINRSVLCWLATVDNGQPSVSPKEVFACYGDNEIIIANIASPQSVNNIKRHDRVCVSFVDVFAQRGFQVYGTASILKPSSEMYQAKKNLLQGMAGDEFEIKALIGVKIDKINPIMAPSYRIHKNMTEEKMIQNALDIYGVVRK